MPVGLVPHPRRPPAPRRVAVGRLDLDHVRAEVARAASCNTGRPGPSSSRRRGSPRAARDPPRGRGGSSAIGPGPAGLPSTDGSPPPPAFGDVRGRRAWTYAVGAAAVERPNTDTRALGPPATRRIEATMETLFAISAVGAFVALLALFGSRRRPLRRGLARAFRALRRGRLTRPVLGARSPGSGWLAAPAR